MSRVLFYLVIKPLSLLPLSVLYLISNWFYYLVYYFIGYRKRVVLQNLQKSFPHYSDLEVTSISKLFYRHLGDIIVESIKMFSMSEAEAIRRCRIRNPELLNDFFDRGKSIVLVGSHYGNWELASISAPNQLKHQIGSIFLRLNNAYFNKKITKSRSRYGCELILKNRIPKFFEESNSNPVALVFIADQSPNYNSKMDNLYWTQFLNQETVTATGVERSARKYNLPVVYFQVFKQRRGYYEVQFELVTDDPNNLPDGEITNRHLRCLEKLITDQPEYWLWSHRRWKHKKSHSA